MNISQPIIVEPVYGLGEAVVVNGHMATADVSIFRIRATDGIRELIGQGKAPKEQRAINIPVKRLATGDKVFAVQECNVNGQKVKSPDPPVNFAIAIALPSDPLPAPTVENPYICAQSVVVGHIVNGATVRIYRNDQQMYELPVGCSRLAATVVPPLEASDQIRADQRFIDKQPATSATESAKAYPERLPEPHITPPLIECGPSFEVAGLIIGAQLVVRELNTVNPVAQQAVSEPVVSVDAGAGLRPEWVLSAYQELCGEPDRSPESTPVHVEPIVTLKQHPPKILGQPRPSDSIIIVEGVHESTIRLVKNGQDIGGGTCYGTTAFNVTSPPPNSPITPIQSFSCQGKVWASQGLAVWPTPKFEVFGADEAEIVSLINAKRLVFGCSPVMTDARLTTAARAHSQDLATHPDIATTYGTLHYGSDGSLPCDENGKPGRITIAMSSTGAEGENVGEGYAGPQDQFDGWFNEQPPNDGHRRNILGCQYKLIGVGIAKAPDGTLYCTADFFGT